MANFAFFTPTKKAAMPHKVGDPLPATFAITDDPNLPGKGNYLVRGRNAAGDIIDISATYTIAVTADASGTVSASTTGAVGFNVQGLKAGSGSVTIVATPNAGGSGAAVSGVASFNVTPGGITGLDVTPA